MSRRARPRRGRPLRRLDDSLTSADCRATVGEEECELFALCEQMITADGGVVKNFIELDLQEFNDDGASDSNSASGPGSIVQS